jgi:replicative DNA helicase
MEKKLIGMLLLDPRTFAVVTPVLKPEHFHGHLNAGWYDRLTEAQRAKCPSDIGLFVTWLREHYGRHELERLGGPAYLAEAMHDTFAHPDYARHAAKVIRNHATRRAIIRAATQLLVDGYAADMPLQELIDRSRAALESVKE